MDHLADLEADFLVFYRIEDIYQLDGPRFMRLAWRVSAYGGVMKLRLEAQAPPPAEARPRGQATTSRAADVVPLDQFITQFPGLLEQASPNGASE